MHITLYVLADYELFFNIDTCDEGHCKEKIQRMFVWSSTNALLNNFWLSKFLRRSLLIFIIKIFRTIVFIVITFRPICPPAFFRCLSNSGTFTELRTTSFTETTVVACSDSVSHNRVQVLSIPVLLLTWIEPATFR